MKKVKKTHRLVEKQRKDIMKSNKLVKKSQKVTN